ncbi:patatin-like phospholipase family protein [Pedobacter sp. L105]|uniref:patatin-like phospholipase family protein n=1 Tax=Pedobacter sp. L105 TaxID=1641871 RepID=UPI00131DE658|nr:patatin-like phospholipase family protein [Pedobacter sp. L105]
MFSKDKRSLILAGGGVRLAYHAGVLIALEEAGISFNHVDGTSGGIFGTAMLASGITPKETAVRWRKLNLKGFMSAMPLKDYLSQHTLSALGSANGIRKRIFPALGINAKKINENTAFDATFNVCNFSKKTIECIDGKAVNEDYLIAGMSLPIFMPAIQINNNWYTDAVWIKDANLTEAVNRGAEEIWLVWCIGNTSEYLNGSFNQYVHMIEISANGGLFAEIEWLRQVNTSNIQNGLQPVTLRIIKPEYALPLDPDFLFNKINADTLINMGYADTRRYLATDEIFDTDKTVDQSSGMKTAAASLHFRQQFRGKIVIEGQKCAVTINLSFFIREINKEYVYQQYASISIDQGDLISGFENTLTISRAATINSEFKFNYHSVNYTVCIKMQLNSIVDLVLGLDNKTAMVNIGSDETQGKEALFIQPAINRIKNAFYLNVNADTGWYGKIKIKHKLLSNLFNQKK